MASPWTASSNQRWASSSSVPATAVRVPRIAGYVVDFLIIGTPIVLECDGWEFHAKTRAQQEADAARDAHLAELGYISVRFTYHQIVRQPARQAPNRGGDLPVGAGTGRAASRIRERPRPDGQVKSPRPDVEGRDALLRGHADAAVGADGLGVEVAVRDALDHDGGQLLGVAETGREQHALLEVRLERLAALAGPVDRRVDQLGATVLTRTPIAARSARSAASCRRSRPSTPIRGLADLPVERRHPA